MTTISTATAPTSIELFSHFANQRITARRNLRYVVRKLWASKYRKPALAGETISVGNTIVAHVSYGSVFSTSAADVYPAGTDDAYFYPEEFELYACPNARLGCEFETEVEGEVCHHCCRPLLGRTFTSVDAPRAQ